MSAFGIFALILTTAYIIYFAAVIIKDVAASRKSPEGGNLAPDVFNALFLCFRFDAAGYLTGFFRCT